jgi:hypothetical protein
MKTKGTTADILRRYALYQRNNEQLRDSVDRLAIDGHDDTAFKLWRQRSLYHDEVERKYVHPIWISEATVSRSSARRTRLDAREKLLSMRGPRKS